MIGNTSEPITHSRQIAVARRRGKKKKKNKKPNAKGNNAQCRQCQLWARGRLGYAWNHKLNLNLGLTSGWPGQSINAGWSLRPENEFNGSPAHSRGGGDAFRPCEVALRPLLIPPRFVYKNENEKRAISKRSPVLGRMDRHD